MSRPSSPQKIWRHWGIVEEKIKKEVDWLRSTVSTYSKEEKLAPMGCRECFMRKIAILSDLMSFENLPYIKVGLI